MIQNLLKWKRLIKLQSQFNTNIINEDLKSDLIENEK